MSTSELKRVNHDVHVLVQDAQTLLQDAAALTQAKSEEVRVRGKQLLDQGMVKAHEMQANTVVAGKKMVTTAEDYVRENPRRAMAAMAGVGVVLGALLVRK